MFSGTQRKTKLLFGLSDILLTVAAFGAAYASRVWLPLEHPFFLRRAEMALLLGFSALVWLGMGIWLNVYERLESSHPRTILRDSFRQSFGGLIAVVLLEYLLKLDLSRPFLALFGVYSWVLLCVFRLSMGRVVRVLRREFGAERYVLVVGVERAHAVWARRWSSPEGTASACSVFWRKTARRRRHRSGWRATTRSSP